MSTAGAWPAIIRRNNSVIMMILELRMTELRSIITYLAQSREISRGWVDETFVKDSTGK